MATFSDTIEYASHGVTMTATHGRFTLTATLHHDTDAGAPWDNEDGHGPVSDWTSRDKAPGELVLATDGRSKRYYDFAEACRIARRDGWGCRDGRQEGETAAAYAARAARLDFEALKAWCEDDWTYFGVVVTVSAAGVELGMASLWGIEGNLPGSDNSYLVECANQLVGEAMAVAHDKLAELCGEGA